MAVCWVNEGVRGTPTSSSVASTKWTRTAWISSFGGWAALRAVNPKEMRVIAVDGSTGC